jgi:hypothetical protein
MPDKFSYLSSNFYKSYFLQNIQFYFIISVLVFSIHSLHIGLYFTPFTALWSKLMLCALVESFFEAMLLCSIGTIVNRFKILSVLLIVTSSFFPVIHLIDFILERVFNLGFWHTLISFFSESPANMLELLLATNFPLWAWGLGFVVLGGLCVLFMSLYKILSSKFVSLTSIFNIRNLFLIVVTLCLIYIPTKKSLSVSPSLSIHQAKVLPFKTLFMPQNLEIREFDLKPCESSTAAISENLIGKNLYLFIVESLREDAITPLIAPHISELGQKNIRHPFCVANANGTHLSWYSFFFSQTALKWKNHKRYGSPFLEDLKKQGFKVNILSSARMSYYSMDKLIFGKNFECIDDLYYPKGIQALTAYEADSLCFEEIKQRLSQNQEKTAFVVFLDATHFGYSLPKNKILPFSPSVDQLPYLQSIFTHINIEGIKNRYYNAIYSVDKLFGEFFDFLKIKQLFEDSTIMITSDHGEEFFEQGQLFHASHLSNQQLMIPFILKAPKDYSQTIGTNLTLSHQNMAPLIQAVIHNKSFSDFPYQIAARYNFSDTPKQMALIDKKGKSLFSLDKTSDKFKLCGSFDAEDVPIEKKVNKFEIKSAS